MKLAIISVTKSGDKIASNIEKHFDVDLYSKYSMESFNLKKVTEKCFKTYKALVFISSTGIAVRAIAPFIEKKDKDPAVVVIDSFGEFVISLLSGHLGGANALSEKLAKVIKANPIITTATDKLGIKAPDIIAKENNLIIDDLKIAKEMAKRLINKEDVGFFDEDSLIDLEKGYVKSKDSSHIVAVTNKENIFKGKKVLKLIRKNIVIGIGCRKNYDYLKMRDNVLYVLKKYNIDKRAVKSIVTVEIKKDEEAILKLKEFLNCDFKVFKLEDIKSIQDKFNGSNFVEKAIGVRCVCEPSVELLKAKIIHPKEKMNGMTIAIGKM